MSATDGLASTVARPRRPIGLAVAALSLLVAAACWPRPAAADVGVALGTGRISVAEPLAPGSKVSLPALSVRNPGTETSSYRVEVVPTLDGTRRRVDPSWVVIPQRAIVIRPGASEPVELELHLGDHVTPGRYETVIAAELIGDGGLTSAAAGATVRFDVAATERSSVDPARRAPSSADGSDPTGPAAQRWWWAIVAVLLAAGVASAARTVRQRSTGLAR